MNNHPRLSPPLPSPHYGTTLVDRINLSIHFRRYFKLVARRWVVLFVATALGLAYGLYQASTYLNLFQAQAELEVAPKLQVTTAGGAAVLEPMDQFYANQLRTMESAALREQVLKLISAGRTPKLEPPNTRRFAARGQGSAFQLGVVSPDLDYARLYASNWAHAFILYKKERFQKKIEEKKYAFQQDLFRQQQNLEKAREASDRFRREHQIGSASDTYKAAQQQLEQLKNELALTQTQARLLQQTPREAIASGALAENRTETLPRPANPNSPAGPDSADPLSKFTPDTSYVQLRAQLNERTTQYGSLTNTLKPKHPEMIRLSREIAQLNQKISFQLQIIEDKRQASVESLKLKEQGLAGRIAELTRQVQDLKGIQEQYERLQKDEARIEEATLSLKNTLQQIDLSTPDEEQFSIVGDVSTASIKPQKTRAILRGVGVGFLLGLALIYFLNRLDDRLELAEDVEAALQEPVLGQVPHVDIKGHKEPYLLVTRMQRHSMFAEAIRGVRSAIMLGPHQGRKQGFVVSSAVPGDGKTTFTVNFAATLAIAGNKVLLVDADMRRGNVHNFFGHAREPGLAEVLAGECPWTEAVFETSVPSLRVLPSGKLPPLPGELLVSPVMRQLVAEARRQYDYLILDCPPLTAIDDTFSALQLMDGLLFVVRSGQTSMRFAKTALAAVRQRGATILGIVLNGITADNPYYYYNYYYHSYYNRELETAAEAAAPTPAPAPVLKSARRTDQSILGGAIALTGHTASPQDIEQEVAAKAALFKARRAARQTAPEPPAPSARPPEPVARSRPELPRQA